MTPAQRDVLKRLSAILRKRADLACGAVYGAEEGEAADLMLALAAEPALEHVATIRTWVENGEVHAKLVDWDDAVEDLPPGEYALYPRRIDPQP